MARLTETYPEDVRVAYRHFPLTSIHDKAALSTQAAEAAGLQGQFWEMHDLLFERQDEWSGMTVEQFQTWVTERAVELGLDEEQFVTDMTSAELAEQAQAAWDRGVEIGMPGTPFLLINGQIYDGPLNFGNLDAIVRVLLLEEIQYTQCPEMTIDPARQYIATIQTEKGDIVIELFPEQAPLAVNNFVFLARDGWYDGVTFHRVLPGFVAQAGDPSGTGFGGPGYAFGNEVSPDLKFDQAGVVGMANAGPDSNGSQFFITLDAAPNLDGGYTIFGRVIEGLEVIEALSPRDPGQSMNLPPGDQILGIVIEEN